MSEAERIREALKDFPELDQLRKENAELKELLRSIKTRLQVAGGAFPTLVDLINAALSKPEKV